MKTIHVTMAGTKDGDGSPEKPFNDPGTALAKVAEPAIVYQIAPGRYTGWFIPDELGGAEGQTISFVCSAGRAIILPCAYDQRWCVWGGDNANYLEFAGLDFVGAELAGQKFYAGHVRLGDNRYFACGTGPEPGSHCRFGVWLSRPGGNTSEPGPEGYAVVACSFFGCGIEPNSDWPIRLCATRGRVVGNSIYDCAGGIYAHPSATLSEIADNRIVKSPGQGIGVAVWPDIGCPCVRVHGNLLVGTKPSDRPDGIHSSNGRKFGQAWGNVWREKL